MLCASSSSSADDDETSSSKSSSALPRTPGTSVDALDAVMMSPETEITTKTTNPDIKTFSEDVLAVCSKGYDFALQSLDKKLDLAIKLDPATGELLSDDNEQSVNLRQQKGLEEEKFAIDVLECLASSSGNGGGEENKQRIRALMQRTTSAKRSYALAELKLNDIDPSKLLAPTENTITEIKKKLGVAVGALVIVGAIVTSGKTGAHTASGHQDVCVFEFFISVRRGGVKRGGAEFGFGFRREFDVGGVQDSVEKTRGWAFLGRVFNRRIAERVHVEFAGRV